MHKNSEKIRRANYYPTRVKSTKSTKSIKKGVPEIIENFTPVLNRSQELGGGWHPFWRTGPVDVDEGRC